MASVKKYTVVIRCTESLLRIPFEGGIRVAPILSPHGEYELTMRQRTEQAPHIEMPIPRELWAEITGPAPSLEVAISTAGAIANDYLRQLAFGANAWQGLIGVHLAYDSSAGLSERQFFQNWIVDERGLPRVAREVDTHLMYRFLAAIASVSAVDRPRILSAVVQYTDALQHWKPGGEIYALSHLYMGVEAITPLIINREIARRGLSNRKQLENILRGPPADSLVLRITSYLYRKAGGHIPSRLDPWARRDLIFRGDKNTYRAAQKASNQLEHGIAHHADIQPLAVQAVTRTAEYLRAAVLELLPLSAADRDELTNGVYATPFSANGFERQLLGTIKSETGKAALPDQLHPFVRWEFNLVHYKHIAGGSSEMRVNQKIQPFLDASASLTIERIRFAGPTPMSHTNIEFDVARGDSPKQGLITKAGAHLAIDPPGAAEWSHLVGSYILNTNSLLQLARFWIGKLDPSVGETAKTLMLVGCVERIGQIVNSDERLAECRQDCQSLWKEAIDVDEVRSLLSMAFTGENGLVVPLIPPNGKASEIREPGRLRELNDHSVNLAQQLAALLDRLMELRVDLQE